MLALSARVDLGLMAMKGYRAFLKAPALMDPHYQIVLCHIQETRRRAVYTLYRDAVDVFYIQLEFCISSCKDSANERTSRCRRFSFVLHFLLISYLLQQVHCCNCFLFHSFRACRRDIIFSTKNRDSIRMNLDDLVNILFSELESDEEGRRTYRY